MYPYVCSVSCQKHTFLWLKKYYIYIEDMVRQMWQTDTREIWVRGHKRSCKVIQGDLMYNEHLGKVMFRMHTKTICHTIKNNT